MAPRRRSLVARSRLPRVGWRLAMGEYGEERELGRKGGAPPLPAFCVTHYGAAGPDTVQAAPVNRTCGV
jgi:hypothetical protein